MTYLETHGISLVLGLLSCGFESQSQKLSSQQAFPAQNQTPQSTAKESGERFVIVTIATEADSPKATLGTGETWVRAWGPAASLPLPLAVSRVSPIPRSPAQWRDVMGLDLLCWKERFHPGEGGGEGSRSGFVSAARASSSYPLPRRRQQKHRRPKTQQGRGTETPCVLPAAHLPPPETQDPLGAAPRLTESVVWGQAMNNKVRPLWSTCATAVGGGQAFSDMRGAGHAAKSHLSGPVRGDRGRFLASLSLLCDAEMRTSTSQNCCGQLKE